MPSLRRTTGIANHPGLPFKVGDSSIVITSIASGAAVPPMR